jgi:hypothetical protein
MTVANIHADRQRCLEANAGGLVNAVQPIRERRFSVMDRTRKGWGSPPIHIVHVEATFDHIKAPILGFVALVAVVSPVLQHGRPLEQQSLRILGHKILPVPHLSSGEDLEQSREDGYE